MLKRFFDKSEIWFAVASIAVYCILMSAGDALSETVGLYKSVTLVFGVLLSAILLVFLKKNGLFKTYGLCKAEASAKSMLYYVPLLVMLTANLWYGVTVNYGVAETAFYILSMFCVGFLEEIIFRGLLFRAMLKGNARAAVIVSAVTFGMGHIINLINGSGAALALNLLQVVYATAAGFMFVMMYVKSKSLIACIVAHGVFNALSVFVNEASMTLEMHIVSCVLLTVITGGYAMYLAWSVWRKKSE